MTKPVTSLNKRTIDLLEQRGVSLEAIANLVVFLQKDYIQDLTLAMARDSVQAVLRKREVQNALITGIQLDIAAEQHALLDPLQTIVERDEGLYGVDETMALSIVDLYGSIGYELRVHRPGQAGNPENFKRPRTRQDSHLPRRSRGGHRCGRRGSLSSRR